MDKPKKLRELFRERRIIKVMGAHNGLSARLAQDAGFDAVWASGLEISTASCVPDANILTMTDFLNAAISMNEAVSIPVIADCDTGFGNSSNAIQMVKKYESSGIAAVCVEDKHFPKVNSFIPGRQELAPVSEFMGKILAAKNAQANKNFMVIARVEALIAGWGMEEALKRANAYVDVGADAVLIHSKSKTVDEIAEFSRLWKERAPLIVVPTTYFNVKTSGLEKLKIKMVIYANHGMRASIRAMEDIFSRVYKEGTTSGVEKEIASMKEVFEIQGMPQMKEQELVYSRQGGDHVIAIIPAAGDHLEEYSMKAISADIPISMLDINSKPLLQRQVEVLNRCKVYEIYVVAGYKKESIDVGGVKIVANDKYKETGVLYSLLQALDKVNKKVFVVYGDILFDHTIVERLSGRQEDILLIVNRFDLKDYGSDKKLDFVITDKSLPRPRRVLHSDTLRMVKGIGSGVRPENAEYEFPGIMFLSQKGAKILRDYYKRHKAGLKKSGIADLLAGIIKSGKDVYCMEMNSGWMEVHSMDDYRAVCALTK